MCDFEKKEFVAGIGQIEKLVRDWGKKKSVFYTVDYNTPAIKVCLKMYEILSKPNNLDIDNKVGIVSYRPIVKHEAFVYEIYDL